MTKIADMIRAGWGLIPIPPRQKGPTTSGWNKREHCVMDVENASQLEGINIGLAHAYCKPSPTCAIDIDNYKPAKQWFATHGLDLNELLLASGAPVIWSGKQYSLKILYRLPESTAALESKKINGLDGKSILEFRCATKDGKTVQDVLPPSIHPDGHQYRWLSDGDPLQIPELPPTLLTLWQSLIANRCRVATRKFSFEHTAHRRQETPRQVAIIKSALDHISADCSYEIWRNIVWATLSTGWNCAESLAQSWSQTAPDRYDEDAFWLVANSYMPNHANPISVGTLYYHARKGGWNG